MESAIPPHLSAHRTRDPRTPDGYAPPYPSYVARHDPGVLQVVMAYFGAQYRGPRPSAVDRALDGLAGDLAAGRAADAPGHWDRAHYVDEEGYDTVLTIAYWDDPSVFDRWYAAHGPGWTGDERAGDGVGWFVELLRPAVERYETLFSSVGRPEGVAVLADGFSGEVAEHAYWGGARDRIPLAQTDPLAPSPAPEAPSVQADGPRLRVTGSQNVCLIRSGQDWGDTGAQERSMYLSDVEPVLRRGMDFLRDDGLGIGCYANRYVQVLGPGGGATDKTFGMSWWRSLADLEHWAESHPTHVDIFGAALRHLSTMGPAARLRLYHEVTVAAAGEQSFTYLGCHPRTGLLRAVPVDEAPVAETVDEGLVSGTGRS